MSPFSTFLYDVANNRSSFTGREIAPPNKLTGNASGMKEIAVKNYIDYIYKFAFPAWAPSLLPGFPQKLQVTTGGYSFKNLEDAIAQRPDVFGKTKDWKAVVMGEVFGLKTRPFDLNQERARTARDYKDNVQAITTQMKHVSMDGDLSGEQKQQLFSKLRDDLININRAFRARD